ncbi:hypothetical protein ACSPX5_07875 [Pseudomonas sp. HLG18]|uniref:hypothetical protein n=1 Tax=Pseudomonas sp. HLG18 TaxID=3449277 RepID=UPI003F747AE0
MKRFFDYWTKQAQWWGSKKLEWWAAHATAFYFGGSILVIGAKFDELILLKLNEIGDLAAGVFGPLAFLWLVLGYIQQGRELRISSESLKMQADELKASVEQQTAMVEAQKKALENHERSLEPLLLVRYVGIDDQGSECFDLFEVVNHGAYCRNVVADFIGKNLALAGIQVVSLAKDSPQRFRATGPIPYNQVWKLQLTYEKINGQTSSQSFGMSKRASNGRDTYVVIEDKGFIDDIDA